MVNKLFSDIINEIVPESIQKIVISRKFEGRKKGFPIILLIGY